MKKDIFMSSIPEQKKAVIDIGTNSIKLCIAESSNIPDGYSVIYDKNKITRLGEGLSEKKELGTLSFERSIQTIQYFVTKAQEFEVNEIRAVGTAALRKAANAELFCSKIKDCCGIDVEILGGEQEAQLSLRAAAHSARGKDSVIFDIGGGSVELIYSQNNIVCSRFSLDFGVLDINEKYFLCYPLENDSVNKACLGIADNLREGGLSIPEYKFSLIGIGGAVTTMASVKLKLSKYLPSKVNETILHINDIESQIHRYQNSTLEERAKIPGLCADRADIILAGACIVRTIMYFFTARNVIVCSNGLRHAVLAEMFKE
jgi:exopolyphosphatase/guanosine-5'-triphosphate,3'-diphosphate pyrophosphatase